MLSCFDDLGVFGLVGATARSFKLGWITIRMSRINPHQPPAAWHLHSVHTSRILLMLHLALRTEGGHDWINQKRFARGWPTTDQEAPASEGMLGAGGRESRSMFVVAVGTSPPRNSREESQRVGKGTLFVLAVGTSLPRGVVEGRGSFG